MDVRALCAEAERTWPNECVGALLSDGSVVPLENVAPEPARSFEVTARALLELEADAEARGLDIKGYFHSHPNRAAVPSADDLRFLVEGRVMVIVAVHEGKAGEVRAWAQRDGALVEAEIRTISS
jgi:proteasome lid subunit RPN8/RPN11